MKTKIIEATNGPQNWGRFMLMRPDAEWGRGSALSGDSDVQGVTRMSILAQAGWAREHIVVYDLVTNEGATFRPGGSAHHDLEKHKIWVCPLFEPFLEWLYTQDVSDFDALPDHIDLPDAPFIWSGYRRNGAQS